MIGPRHDRFSTGPFDRLGDAAVVAGDRDRSDIGFPGPAPNMHDHRFSGNQCKRLRRQAPRRHTRRDENDWMHFCSLSDLRSSTPLVLVPRPAPSYMVLISCRTFGPLYLLIYFISPLCTATEAGKSGPHPEVRSEAEPRRTNCLTTPPFKPMDTGLAISVFSGRFRRRPVALALIPAFCWDKVAANQVAWKAEGPAGNQNRATIDIQRNGNGTATE